MNNLNLNQFNRIRQNERMNELHRNNLDELIDITITDIEIKLKHRRYIDLDNTIFQGKDWFDCVYYSPDKIAWILKEIKFPDYIEKFNISDEGIGFSTLMNGHDANHNDVLFCKIVLSDENEFYMLRRDCDISFPINKHFFCYPAELFIHEVRNYRPLMRNERKTTNGARFESLFNFPGKDTGFYFPDVIIPTNSPLLNEQISKNKRLNTDKLENLVHQMEQSVSSSDESRSNKNKKHKTKTTQNNTSNGNFH